RRLRVDRRRLRHRSGTDALVGAVRDDIRRAHDGEQPQILELQDDQLEEERAVCGHSAVGRRDRPAVALPAAGAVRSVRCLRDLRLRRVRVAPVAPAPRRRRALSAEPPKGTRLLAALGGSAAAELANADVSVRGTVSEPNAAIAARRIAVLVPCFNESLTVAKVIADFRAALPACVVYVYDNRSTDGTGDIARNAGAVVRREERPGKGGVMRRMFAEIDADIYVVTDGDATYDATRAPEMIERLTRDDLDVVTGVRDHEERDAAYRRGHQF